MDYKVRVFRINDLEDELRQSARIGWRLFQIIPAGPDHVTVIWDAAS